MCELVANQLLAQGYIEEVLHSNAYGGIYVYVSRARKAQEILSGKVCEYKVSYLQVNSNSNNTSSCGESSKSSTTITSSNADPNSLEYLLYAKRQEIADQLDKQPHVVHSQKQMTLERTHQLRDTCVNR